MYIQSMVISKNKVILTTNGSSKNDRNNYVKVGKLENYHILYGSF